MFILKKGHQPGVYVPLRALFLVHWSFCSQKTTLALSGLDPGKGGSLC